jgi:hypothetical protein
VGFEFKGLGRVCLDFFLWAGLVVLMYLGAPYAFLIKPFLLIKN